MVCSSLFVFKEIDTNASASSTSLDSDNLASSKDANLRYEMRIALGLKSRVRCDVAQ